jgi:hypothetical protein
LWRSGVRGTANLNVGAFHPDGHVHAALEEEGVGHSPQELEQGIVTLLNRLPEVELERFLSFWRQYHGKDFRVGTIFSGTDVVVTCLSSLLQVHARSFTSMFGLSMR